MRHIVLLLVAVALLAIAAPASAQMKYGKWEITTKMDMPGMPMEMPPMTHTQCLTEEDMSPQPEQPEQNCDTTSHVDGNTVHFTVTCETPEGAMKGEGSSTYTGDTMTGSMHMVMQGEEAMEMTQHYTGRYLGPCE